MKKVLMQFFFLFEVGELFEDVFEKNVVVF